jgi:hypothetical protein
MSGASSMVGESAVVNELKAALPPGVVCSQPEEVGALLRDQSWLSPVLRSVRAQRAKEEGVALGVEAAVIPRNEHDLAAALAIAARHRTPITLRAAGTTNFGLIDPKHGGLVFDMRGLDAEPEVLPGAIRASAGSILADLETGLAPHGAQMPVLTTTFRTATLGGWLAGGHVGLGSSTHGAVWDGLVRSVRLMTVEETPRILTLSGDEVEPVLHSFGVTGVIVDAVMKTAPARQWVEAVGRFPTFAHASAFTTEISSAPDFAHRVVAAQEEALTPGLNFLADVLGEDAAVLTILDRSQLSTAQALARTHGGQLIEWQPWSMTPGQKASIDSMVYGHRMLWVKRLFPNAGFLHVYPDPRQPDEALSLLKARFGDEVLLEAKFIRSPWMLKALGAADAATLPAAVVGLRDATQPGAIQALADFCDEAGILYQNPHVSAVEDNGLFEDVAPIVALKTLTDPYNLLHRGRLRSATTRP